MTTNNPARQRILVIDDNRDSARTLAMLLKIKGHDVYERYSGADGIAATESLQPDVVVLDISMPEMDGYQTCRLIRQQPWGKNLYLIALSGYSYEDDRLRSGEAGFDAHLVKPVDLEELIRLVSAGRPAGSD
ncbi:hypothetical protein GCM10023189_16340 [Nibrella saemangeumensis]|uniref:Response regulatory domain-containing protein n=1 Tax=Nibrella saemangeumensis TaxID=1084526 RepID=A0ABP8MQH6_9BACT